MDCREFLHFASDQPEPREAGAEGEEGPTRKCFHQIKLNCRCSALQDDRAITHPNGREWGVGGGSQKDEGDRVQSEERGDVGRVWAGRKRMIYCCIKEIREPKRGSEDFPPKLAVSQDKSCVSQIELQLG